MSGKEQKEIWQEIKEIWNHSSEGERINFHISKLMIELRSKVSQFEKDAISRDISKITESISDFERDSIKGDIAKITRSLRKFLNLLRKKK